MIRILIASLSVLISSQSLYGDDSAASTVGGEMTTAAQRFLKSLNDEQSAKAHLEFDNPARQDWHNIPKPTRKGLQFRDMNDAQKENCRALLRAALSESGYDKALKIMSLENNLREGEKSLTGGPLRDPDRYFLTVFGKPEMKGAWGWSFEGHHLSLNFVIRDGQVISDTPSFWGANPATVSNFIDGGPAVGTRLLGQEEQLAFDLLDELDADQKSKTIIAEKAPADYRAAGQPQPPQSAPEGLTVAEMTESQRKKLLSLIEVYISHFHPSLAQVQMAEIKANGFDRIYFAWAGATKPGVGHYYRLQGPTFVLELINVQNDPAGNPANHIHSVWRSLQGDFALPAGDAKQ
jgi:hypothetical protein